MILSEDEITPEQESLISIFISSLWDVGNFKPVLVYALFPVV